MKHLTAVIYNRIIPLGLMGIVQAEHRDVQGTDFTIDKDKIGCDVDIDIETNSALRGRADLTILSNDS